MIRRVTASVSVNCVLSVTVIEKDAVPAEVGVPEMVPVAESSDSPFGSDPEDTDHEYGAVPLVTPRTKE